MIPSAEAGPEPHKTGHRMLDLAVAGSALLVSLVSLGIAVHHGHTMQRLVEANSMPFVQFSTGNSDAREADRMKPVMTVSVENAGTGPARVERFTLLFDGKPQADWKSLMTTALHEAVVAGRLQAGQAQIGSYTLSDVAPNYLRPGAQVYALTWARSEANAPYWDEIDRMRLAGHIDLQACYCSMFDDCWDTSMKVFRPRPVPHC